MLKSLRFSPPLQGLALLLILVLLTPTLKQLHPTLGLPAMLWGLVAWKVLQSLYSKATDIYYDDILPAGLWLAGLLWIPLGVSEAQQPAMANLLLGSLGISQVLRFFHCQACPLKGRFFLKPLLLAALGGVGVLVLAGNVLLFPHPFPWALLFAGGLLLAALLNALGEKDLQDPGIPQVVIVLALIGLGTLVASRMFGAIGWVFLGVSALSVLRPGYASIAILFWIGRLVLQAFIIQYNPNVTGINLMHPYVSAALFGGVMLMLLMPSLLQAARTPLLALLGFLGGGALLAALSNYFLHAEATGSLLVSATVAALCTAIALPLYQSAKSLQQFSLLLLFPTHLTLTALMTHGLLELGDTAEKGQKLTILLITGGVLLGVWLLSQWKALRTRPV